MSQNKNLSRRDFLKVTLLSLTATFLAACGRALGIPVTPTPTASPTSTNTKTPQPTSTDTPTSTPTETATPTPIPCFKLLTPENGTTLPALGKVTFSWEPMPGATRYQLQFTLQSKQVVSFDMQTTSSTRYIESFLMSGKFTWQVTAFDGNDAVICVSDPFTFVKAEYESPSGNNNDGSQTGGGPGAGSGGAQSGNAEG